MNNHIPTLLLREWMQHKRGWLIAAFAPPVLFLAMLPFGQVQGLPTEQLELVALVALVVSACVVYAICLLVALFQLPGLARRDAQDRSIEFWLSLPGRPSESVAATLSTCSRIRLRLQPCRVWRPSKQRRPCRT